MSFPYLSRIRIIPDASLREVRLPSVTKTVTKSRIPRIPARGFSIHFVCGRPSV